MVPALDTRYPCRPSSRLDPSRRLEVVRPRRRQLDPMVYRRRRLAVGGLLLLLFAAALVLVQSVTAGTGGGPLTTTGAAALSGPMTPAGASVWVVRAGDSLWSIAASLDPSGDPRPLVDRLMTETDGGDLYPGERVAIPAPYR